MVSRLAIAATLALSAWPCHAVESVLLGQVSELPATWRIVKRCGSWHQGGREGYYRIVVGDVYGGAGSELYVQWILHATQDQPPEVVKTLSFPELNDDHNQYDFRAVDCVARGRSTMIRASATNEHDEDDRMHEITVRLIDIGRYELSVKARSARR